MDDGNGAAVVFYPVQADIPPDRTRLLYFLDEASQKQCVETLLQVQGFSDQLEQFEFLKELGSGASGQVMLVEHKLTQEKFALKAIPYTAYKERHQKQVAAEIEMQARCKNCPNIVRFKE